MENQRYKVGRHPNITAEHNRRTWAALESQIGASSASFADLVGWCEGHRFAGGGRGFVNYCIRSGWLVPVGSLPAETPAPVAKKSQPATPVVLHLGPPRPSTTGVYIAYPTTPKPKPIYRGLKTMVNDQHTKVGITKDSFAARAKVYEDTFGGEVVFTPVVEFPAHLLEELERCILFAMERRYQRVGKAREWFHTVDRDTITALIQDMARRSAR